MSTDTLNLAEAAAYLKLGLNSTRELFEAGVLPGLSLNQKHTLFLRSDLEAFVRDTARRQSEQRKADSAPPPPPAPRAKPSAPKRAVKPDLSRYEATG